MTLEDWVQIGMIVGKRNFTKEIILSNMMLMLELKIIKELRIQRLMQKLKKRQSKQQNWTGLKSTQNRLKNLKEMYYKEKKFFKEKVSFNRVQI
jgi:hypothetical protein